MPALATNLKTRLADPQAVTAWLVSIALASGTKRYGLSSYASAGTGFFDGLLLSISELSDSWSDRSGTVQAREVVFQIADPDQRFWSKQFEGANAHTLINTAVTVHFAETGAAFADWSLRFSGIITNIGFDEPFVCTIRARTDDLAMRRQTPKSRWTITLGDFPQANAEILGRMAPIVYGDLDSRQHGAKGAVECLYIDTLNYRYLVCAGIPKGAAAATLRFYKDGVPVVNSGATAYTVTTPGINGKVFTLIDFTSTQGDAVITADVQGYATSSDGTGTLIESAPDVLAHYLSNFVFGDWYSGAWLSTSSRINAAALADTKTWLDNRSYKNAKAVLDRTEGYTILQEWLQSNEARARWGRDGTLVLGYADPTFTDIYNATIPRLKHDEGFSYQTDDQAIISALVVNYANIPVENRYAKTMELTNVNARDDLQEDMNQPFGPLI